MTPKTWGQQTIRHIELRTLQAMAKAINGECHNYTVERTSDHRVRVTYSNPDEYASDHPITAFFPCYKGSWGEWWVVNAITEIIFRDRADSFERDIADQHFEWISMNEIVDPNLEGIDDER